MILCSKLKNGLCKIVTKSQIVTKFNVTKSRLNCTDWGFFGAKSKWGLISIPHCPQIFHRALPYPRTDSYSRFAKVSISKESLLVVLLVKRLTLLYSCTEIHRRNWCTCTFRNSRHIIFIAEVVCLSDKILMGLDSWNPPNVYQSK